MSMIIRKQRSGAGACRRVAVSLTMLGAVAGAAFSISAPAAVIEYFNPDLNNYFITADPTEQAFVDSGAVGRWQRTGLGFATGGSNEVCRFYGNGAINPATGTFFGPNSHFYTADPVECAGLKALYSATTKSWKFESNDFRTTPAINETCPAGLAPVYRAYNNGFARGIDSNHRITTNFAAYQQTVAAGSIGEGVVMCAPAPSPTAVGIAVGSGTSATIGPAGGSVSSTDGKIAVTVPAGALAAPTLIIIQPLTNMAHGKIGAAYRLTPDGQTFLKPITLAFAYTDADLAGTAVEVLGAAFQTADGYWEWAGDATVDVAAKTVSVAIDHFTDFSFVKGLQIRPASTTAKVNTGVILFVENCYDRNAQSFNPRGYECSGLALGSSVKVTDWSVNDRKGGGDIFGTVSQGSSIAIYRAPVTAPIPSTVAVSGIVDRGAKGKTLLVSHVTITEGSWTGTATSKYPGIDIGGGIVNYGEITATAQVTWTLESSVNKVVTYRPTGTVTVGGWCSYSPPSFALNPATNGSLVIDYNSSPPTYSGIGSSQWSATLSCPPGAPSFQSLATALFMGGSKALARAEGFVSADGLTIEGTDTNVAGTIFNWKFTRDE